MANGNNIMSMAGLMVMSGENVGNALLKAASIKQQEDHQRYQQQQQQQLLDLRRQKMRYDMQKQQQQQQMMQRLFGGQGIEQGGDPSGGGIGSSVTTAPAAGISPDKLAMAGMITGNPSLIQGAQFMRDDVRREAEENKRKKQQAVVGFDVMEGVEPSAEDSKAIKKMEATRRKIEVSANKLDKLLQEHGTESFDLYGGESGDMSALREDIIVNFNTLAGLGALSGDDKKILESIIPDPNAFFTSGGTARRRLRDFIGRIRQMTDAEANSRGFVRKGQEESNHQSQQYDPLGIL